MQNSVRVKICGLKRESDVELCMESGVDVIGFVTEYPVCVPWNLSRGEAQALLSKVRAPHQSCIVTGGSPKKVIELASELKPSMVQLHYNETLADTAEISESLEKLNIGVIKTVPRNKEDRISQFGTTDIRGIVNALCKTKVYGLLVDSRNPANASEQGKELDLDFCAEVIGLSSKPVIVAGGINAGNVCDIIKRTGTGFIDIMTGVESSPGVKDSGLLQKLMFRLYCLLSQNSIL